MKKFLAMILALALALSVTTLSWADTPAEMDLDAFIKAVVAGNGTYDGQGKTVHWTAVSGCFQTNREHTCTVTNTDGDSVAAVANTPNRIQSPFAQYQLFSTLTDLNIKNTNFVFDVPAGSITVCANSGWSGTNAVSLAELQMKNSGNTTFENCNFNRVTASPYGQGNNATEANAANTATFKKCTFSNVADKYAIKDVYAGNLTVDKCSFTDCGGAIYMEGAANKGTINISGNTFTRIGSKGLIQFSSQGNYADATITLDKNTATDCGPVLRQLNETVDMTKAAGDMSGLVNANGNLSATSDSVGAAGEGDGKEIEVPFTPTPEQPPRYYYNSTTTTDTKADGTKGSPKTFDAGVGIYALTAVLSVTGMAYVGKKKF